MLNHSSKKNGYTLVEVLVVVSIMGILSSMGVVGLHRAVKNSRIKDAAMNTAAFLERMANEANRMSKRICVKKDHDQRITAYLKEDASGDASSCDAYSEVFATFAVESPVKFGCEAAGLSDLSEDVTDNDWAVTGAMFIPRIGLSAAPSDGYVCVQYGTSDTYGLVLKRRTNNMMIPMWKVGGSSADWSRL